MPNQGSGFGTERWSEAGALACLVQRGAEHQRALRGQSTVDRHGFLRRGQRLAQAAVLTDPHQHHGDQHVRELGPVGGRVLLRELPLQAEPVEEPHDEVRPVGGGVLLGEPPPDGDRLLAGGDDVLVPVQCCQRPSEGPEGSRQHQFGRGVVEAPPECHGLLADHDGLFGPPGLRPGRDAGREERAERFDRVVGDDGEPDRAGLGVTDR
ncbi:hypothetical protein OG871_02145 [Kitasatospora sp. NBC_00374]|uniref:hypothetical protein n=1 Tax=Kitasatospora sp. NBC_00374 TaxID=2975964 RepID=UPI003250FC00